MSIIYFNEFKYKNVLCFGMLPILQMCSAMHAMTIILMYKIPRHDPADFDTNQYLQTLACPLYLHTQRLGRGRAKMCGQVTIDETK